VNELDRLNRPRVQDRLIAALNDGWLLAVRAHGPRVTAVQMRTRWVSAKRLCPDTGRGTHARSVRVSDPEHAGDLALRAEVERSVPGRACQAETVFLRVTA
jgi:hypothetical protein